MTPHEVKLWLRLRTLRSIGYHFRRQSPLTPYVVDFECRQSRLVIEVNGDQHGFDEHRRRDNSRDEALQKRGYRILRFSNAEVSRELEGVMEVIYLALKIPTRPLACARVHPPLTGRDEAAPPLSRSHFLSRNALTTFTVWSGCSSMIQWPELLMMPASTLLPTTRMIAAC